MVAVAATVAAATATKGMEENNATQLQSTAQENTEYKTGPHPVMTTNLWDTQPNTKTDQTQTTERYFTQTRRDQYTQTIEQDQAPRTRDPHYTQYQGKHPAHSKTDKHHIYAKKHLPSLKTNSHSNRLKDRHSKPLSQVRFHTATHSIGPIMHSQDDTLTNLSSSLINLKQTPAVPHLGHVKGKRDWRPRDIQLTKKEEEEDVGVREQLMEKPRQRGRQLLKVLRQKREEQQVAGERKHRLRRWEKTQTDGQNKKMALTTEKESDKIHFIRKTQNVKDTKDNKSKETQKVTQTTQYKSLETKKSKETLKLTQPTQMVPQKTNNTIQAQNVTLTRSKETQQTQNTKEVTYTMQKGTLTMEEMSRLFISQESDSLIIGNMSMFVLGAYALIVGVIGLAVYFLKGDTAIRRVDHT